jgi:glycosyltransferase involved in cell wall biosynthesis
MYIIRDMVWNADFVHYVDQYLVNRYPTKGQYFVCPSCQVDVQEDTLEFRLEKLEQSADIITIGLIGYTHNRIKGVDTAIKALALLGPDYRIQIVGRGDHSWLNDLIMKLNLRSQIDFLGVLSGRDKVFEWLDTIDLYVQPSLTEGMPRATIEAMSRGCPVVVSDVGGLKNLVDKKYRIGPTDHEELAQKIRELSQNRTEMYQAAVANFEKAKEFDLTHLNKKRTEFYEMIFNEVQGR